jgi:insulysin
MHLVHPWLVTAMCLWFGKFALCFVLPTVVISKSRHFSTTEFALSCQERDDLFRECLSESPGISRRELLAWGPILAGVLSAAATGGSASAEPSLESKPKFQWPFSSTRKYKMIKLNNELKVLLVSDKQAVRAAAALAIDGAGQFSDPEELPGCAHLMEHMILSSASSSRFRKSADFEDWLSDVEGASNAFTGYEQVCFHFTSPPGVLMEALTRFSSLFNEPDVIKICQNEEILKREIRRVSSELDFENENMQAFYVVKDMMNPEHPYSRFARGNIESLERKPREDGLNVPEILFNFFREHYQSTSASLVVVAPFDIITLERWVSPFNGILSRERRVARKGRIFPKETLLADKRSRQVLLYRPKTEVPLKENIETLSMHWTFDLKYNEPIKSWRSVVTASQVGFVLSQIFGRRGPGSLYYILSRRGWVPEGRQGVPRISFPVDVSGFQLMKLELGLTLDGFANRAVVVAYIYRTINSVFSGESMTRFLVSRQILLQYAVVAELHGYTLAPRPPDAVELAVDEGLKNEKDFDPSIWNRFPAVNNLWGIALLQRAVKDTLIKMSDPSSPIIITTATDKALAKAKQSSFFVPNTFFVGDSVPALPPSNWLPEKVTGAKYYRDDILRFTGPLGDLFTAKTEEEELLPPLTNNLIPPTIRPPRVALHQMYNSNEGRNKNWRILQPGPYTLRLRIPRVAPEPLCRCTFVFQLLSPRPARANTRQAAYAELWKVSFEKSVADLVGFEFYASGLRFTLENILPQCTAHRLRRLNLECQRVSHMI